MVRTIFSALKSRVPVPARRLVRSAINVARRRIWGRYCPVCEQPVRAFLPLPAIHAETFARVGSDLRVEDGETLNVAGYSCPHCGVSDRDRLYALYLAKRLPRIAPEFLLLDIAPTKALSQHIRRAYSVRYRTADLSMEGVDEHVDLTKLPSGWSETVDAFLCSHVLEHIEDDRAAMSELFRVTKSGGWGIAMVPINITLSQIREDPSVVTEAERWKHFGQGDHVRFYTRDVFLQRLHQAGFTTQELGVEYFGPAAFAESGISMRSVLYVVNKP